MSLTLGVITGVVVGRSGVTLLARVVGARGVPITQATLSSVSWTLTDTVAGTALGTGAPSVSAVVFDTLQTDASWTRDSEAVPGPDGLWGYNFAFTIPASVNTSANRCQADVVLTPASGEPLRVPFSWVATRVYG